MKDYFTITSVHRDDLEEAGFDASCISDETMETLASKMCDDYVTQLFWEHLPVFAEALGIPRKTGLVTEPEEMDFFSVEPDYRGGKQVHVLGCCYLSDEPVDRPWRNVEYTFFIEPLEEFIRHVRENEDYVNTKAAEVKQYIGDHSEEEMKDIINHYFMGHGADGVLSYESLTEDTPVGNYITF